MAKKFICNTCGVKLGTPAGERAHPDWDDEKRKTHLYRFGARQDWHSITVQDYDAIILVED